MIEREQQWMNRLVVGGSSRSTKYLCFVEATERRCEAETRFTSTQQTLTPP